MDERETLIRRAAVEGYQDADLGRALEPLTDADRPRQNPEFAADDAAWAAYRDAFNRAVGHNRADRGEGRGR